MFLLKYAEKYGDYHSEKKLVFVKFPFKKEIKILRSKNIFLIFKISIF